MSVRDSFVETFGEEFAVHLEVIGMAHADDIRGPIGGFISLMFATLSGVKYNDPATDNHGSDPFKYTLLMMIGRECVSHPKYRENHGITVEPMVMYSWLVEYSELDSFDGDYPGNFDVILRGEGVTAVEMFLKFVRQPGLLSPPQETETP